MSLHECVRVRRPSVASHTIHPRRAFTRPSQGSVDACDAVKSLRPHLVSPTLWALLIGAIETRLQQFGLGVRVRGFGDI